MLRPSLPASIKDIQDVLQHPRARSACSLGDLGKHCLCMTLGRFGSPVVILPGATTSVAFVATSSSSHMDDEQ